MPLVEDRQVERLALTKPDHMLCMIGEVVTSIRVGEYGEVTAVQHQPLRDLPELSSRNGQLTTPARVRPDGLHVVMPFRYAEQ